MQHRQAQLTRWRNPLSTRNQVGHWHPNTLVCSCSGGGWGGVAGGSAVGGSAAGAVFDACWQHQGQRRRASPLKPGSAPLCLRT